MVQHADDGIRPFTYIHGLIDEVIHLSRYSLAAYSKDCTLSRSEKVHGSRLEGVICVKRLLGHVKGVMCYALVEREDAATLSAGGGGEKSPEDEKY